MWAVTHKIEEELTVRNITVKGIVCDMGPSNQSMWKNAGIKSKRSVCVVSYEFSLKDQLSCSMLGLIYCLYLQNQLDLYLFRSGVIEKFSL